MIEILEGSFADTYIIYNTLSKQEKEYVSPEEFKESKLTLARKIVYIDSEPVSFVEIIKNNKDSENAYAVVATKKEHRNKGYVKILIKEAIKCIPQNVKYLMWICDPNNIPSQKTAAALNFKKLKNSMYELTLNDGG